MGKRGVKVKELAGQLGVTARQLIDRCRAEGVAVQNSITKIPPETERVIRSWFPENGTSAASVEPSAVE